MFYFVCVKRSLCDCFVSTQSETSAQMIVCICNVVRTRITQRSSRGYAVRGVVIEGLIPMKMLPNPAVKLSLFYAQFTNNHSVQASRYNRADNKTCTPQLNLLLLSWGRDLKATPNGKQSTAPKPQKHNYTILHTKYILIRPQEIFKCT